MCGIVGYVGHRAAEGVVIEGLRRLEYRGYDSAGIALVDAGTIVSDKRAGKLANLEKAIAESPLPAVTTGIGHTRWATHGPPTNRNAHPHLSEKGDFAVVHNGIIENAGTLRKRLQERGHVFGSDTDTEVLVHLIEEVFNSANGREGESLERAVETALAQVEGTYGIAVVSTRDPGKIVAARLGSPLLIGVGDNGETFVASDAAAVIAHTRDVIYLDDGDMATITKQGYTVHRRGQGPENRPINRVDWDLGEVERGGYPHFMLKEIMEQPETLRETMRGRLLEDEGGVKLGGLTGMDEELRQARRVVILGCGTSWHSGLIGEYMLEDIARIPTEVEYASEFRYRRPVVEPDTLAIAISQSGETADTLWAMREARQQGATTLGIVNVVGSTIARETDAGIYLHAGPEIGVASTKAFTSQVVVLAMMTVHLGRLRGTLTQSRGREIVRALRQLPEQVAAPGARIPTLDEVFDLCRRAADAGHVAGQIEHGLKRLGAHPPEHRHRQCQHQDPVLGWVATAGAHHEDLVERHLLYTGSQRARDKGGVYSFKARSDGAPVNVAAIPFLSQRSLAERSGRPVPGGHRRAQRDPCLRPSPARHRLQGHQGLHGRR